MSLGNEIRQGSVRKLRRPVVRFITMVGPAGDLRRSRRLLFDFKLSPLLSFAAPAHHHPLTFGKSLLI